MTIFQKRKLIEKIISIESDLDELEKARVEVGVSGFSSATISVSGGSRSYTRMDIDKITKLIGELNNKLTQYKNMLATGNGTPLKTIVPVYS